MPKHKRESLIYTVMMCFVMVLWMSVYNVTLHMNREELASYLNATRPSLSRMLVALQDEGLIRLSSRNKIQILDYDKVSGENG